jgi:hypothetical protein
LFTAILFFATSCEFRDSLSPNAQSDYAVEEASPAAMTPAESTLEPLSTGLVFDNDGQEAVYGYTNHRADGNRVVAGQGTLPGSSFVDIPLDGVPHWLVGVPFSGKSGTETATLWVAVLEDGQIRVFILDNDAVATDGIARDGVGEIPAPTSPLELGPPLLRVVDDRPELMNPPSSASGLSPPAILDGDGNWVYIDKQGDLVFLDAHGVEIGRLAVDALPDGRILVDEYQRLLLLTKPTERYSHGVLGDSLEAGGVALVATEPEASLVLTIPAPEPEVIEGIAPLWVDLTGDGRREIVVTLSGASQGARLAVYDESGAVLASGPAIGQGYRWRHQLAIGPFGPSGETEVVDVLTPHIGGVVEYYRPNDGELEIIAQMPGFTSHVIGSRNLDMAIGGDFDGDGALELLLPNQARSELGAVRRTLTGAEVVWTLPLDGRLSTNLAAVTTSDGRIVVGAGREDGTLRLWP